MAYKIVLILAIACQLMATWLALRINRRYRAHSAWVLISTAALVTAIQQFALLLIIWRIDIHVTQAISLWMACLSALLEAVVFLGGVALIEPLFADIARAELVLKREKQALADVVEQTHEELRVARQIQQNLLPRSAPTLPGFEVAGASQPAEWTSGDFFDYLVLDDGAVCFIVADVSGHGIGPALLMCETRAFFRSFVRTACDPGEILTRVNAVLAQDVTHGRFVTAWFGRLEPDRRILHYAGAGHDAFLTSADGSFTTLASASPPLGIIADHVFETAATVQLEAGQTLLLLTDGIPETRNGEDAEFGMERALHVLHRHRTEIARDIVEYLFQAVRDFAGPDVPQRDDVTALIVKVSGNGR